MPFFGGLIGRGDGPFPGYRVGRGVGRGVSFGVAVGFGVGVYVTFGGVGVGRGGGVRLGNTGGVKIGRGGGVGIATPVPGDGGVGTFVMIGLPRVGGGRPRAGACPPLITARIRSRLGNGGKSVING